MTRSDQLKSVIMAVVVVLSVISAVGFASAEVDPDDSNPIDLIQVDGDRPDIGVVNNTNNDVDRIPRVQSAGGGGNPSTIIVSVNVTDTDRINLTLTNSSSPATDPFAAGANFGVNGSNTQFISDGSTSGPATDLSGGSADGNITIALSVDAGPGSAGNFGTGDELSVVVDDSGSFNDGVGAREAITPAVVVDNRDIDFTGPFKNDENPDIVDANNPNPDINDTASGTTDNDFDRDDEFTVHSREQVKIAANLTRDGPVQIKNVSANISEVSINTTSFLTPNRTNNTIPMHFDANGDGRISDSERGQDGPNGTYIGRFYLNDTDAVRDATPSATPNTLNLRVNVTASDTVNNVFTESSDTGTEGLSFAGLGVGNSVGSGAPPDSDQISGPRDTEPDRFESPTDESINYYVYGQEGDNRVTVVFETELQEGNTAVSGFFSDDDATSGLSRDDFSYIDNDADDATSIQSVQHQPGSHVAVLTLDDDLSQDDVVGTSPASVGSPVSDEIRIPANETYISVGALSGGDVFPLVTNESQSFETDQTIFPTNITDPGVQATPKDPTVNNRSVNPEEQISINATFDIHPYGQDVNETQAAVSFRGTDSNDRFLLKQAFDDGLVDGAEFSDETLRLDGESVVIGRGDRGGEDPNFEVNTTLNLDAFPPGGASGGPLTVEAQAYGVFDSNTIDNKSLATDTSVDIDAVRPVVRAATVQIDDDADEEVRGTEFNKDQVIEVTFSEPVQDNDGNALDASDFNYNNSNGAGAGSIVAVGHDAGERKVNVAMDSGVTESDVDADTLSVESNQIVDADLIDVDGDGVEEVFEVGNTARDGLDEVNRTDRINITESEVAADPAVRVFPDPVKGDDSIIVTTENDLSLSSDDVVLFQVVDSEGNNLDPDGDNTPEPVRVRAGNRTSGDLTPSTDEEVTTRILLSNMTGDQATEGSLTVIAEATTDDRILPDTSSAASESLPIIIDNTRPTVVSASPSDSNELTVQFSEGVYARELARERLTTDEFSLNDNNQGDATEIVSVQHTPGSATATLVTNDQFTTGGPNSDQADDTVGFEPDQVEDEAGNSLIPGSEVVPVSERQIEDLNVITESTNGATEISVRAIDNGSAKSGVSVTFEVTNGDGTFTNNDQQSVVQETEFQNNTPQATATLTGNGTVEISAGGETAEVLIGSGDDGDEPATPAVSFADQTVSNGSTSVDVASATFNGNEAFNIVVHEASDDNDDGTIQPGEIGKKIGESAELDNGTRTDITVNISKQVAGNDNVSQLTENQTLVAMLHTTNTSDGDNIVHTAPITQDGVPVFDQANITVQEQVADPEPPENQNPVIVGDSPATNTDDDALLEDVNGDGESDFQDAVDLAFNTDAASENVDAFDFDGDGDVDFDDAIALAFE